MLEELVYEWKKKRIKKDWRKSLPAPSKLSISSMLHATPQKEIFHLHCFIPTQYRDS